MRPCSSCCSVTKSYLTFVTPRTAAHQASLTFTISWSLLKLMSIRSVIPSKHPILCCPLLLLPSIFPSIRVLYNESALRIRWPNYWSFSISTSFEYSGLISFRIDWFHLVYSKGLSRVLPAHCLKTSVLHAQTSLWYNTHICTWLMEKPYLWIYSHSFGKVMSLLFNMPSNCFIAFLPRSTHLLISWLQPSTALMIVPRK